MVEAAGLRDFEVLFKKDVFSGSPHESSAKNFGTVGVTFAATKP